MSDIVMRYNIKSKSTGKESIVYNPQPFNHDEYEITPAGFYDRSSNTVVMPKAEAEKVLCIDNQYEFKAHQKKKT